MFANIDKIVNITYNNIEYNIVTIMLYSCYNIIKIIDKLYFLKYVYKKVEGYFYEKIMGIKCKRTSSIYTKVL